MTITDAKVATVTRGTIEEETGPVEFPVAAVVVAVTEPEHIFCEVAFMISTDEYAFATEPVGDPGGV